jgi:hypothetical protein
VLSDPIILGLTDRNSTMKVYKVGIYDDWRIILMCYTTRRNIVSSHKITARGYTIVMEGGETTIWRGRRHIMTCAEENGMPWVYLYDLFNLLNEPEQDQGPVNLEPRLIQTNLSVNLLTGPIIGQLAALRGASKAK